MHLHLLNLMLAELAMHLKVQNRAFATLTVMLARLGAHLKVHNSALSDPKILEPRLGVHLKVHSRALLDSFHALLKCTVVHYIVHNRASRYCIIENCAFLVSFKATFQFLFPKQF